MSHTTNLIFPDWHAPENIGACATTRVGGYSTGAYSGLNLAMHVNDGAAVVGKNRQLLLSQLQSSTHTYLTHPYWLKQTHSTNIVRIDSDTSRDSLLQQEFDGSTTTLAGTICTVLTADCLPILITNRDGTQVSAVHAGWRGLADGIVYRALEQFSQPKEQLVAWIGPAISQPYFEVGDDVYQAFCQQEPKNSACFVKHQHVTGKWYADLAQIANNQFLSSGVNRVSGGDHCTFANPEQFYSYRRDGLTGRIATLIWIKN